MTKRSNKVTKAKFLAAYRKNGCQMIRAAEAIGIDRTTVWSWLNKDPEFKKKYEECENLLVEALESKVMEIGIQDKSLTALIFMLKSKRPEVYDDKTRHTKFVNDNNLEDPDTQRPVMVVLERGEEPARLRNQDFVQERKDQEQ